jgi:hypothetical protein
MESKYNRDYNDTPTVDFQSYARLDHSTSSWRENAHEIIQKCARQHFNDDFFPNARTQVVSSAILERVSAPVNESEEFRLLTQKGACYAVENSPDHFLVYLLFRRQIPLL